MSQNGFYVGQFNFLPAKEYEAALKEVVESGWYTNHGPQAQALETDLAHLIGVEHCILVSNATLGLAIAIEAVGKVSRIVMPALSFPATLWAAQFAGLPVSLVDIELGTGHIDVGALSAIAQEDDLLVVPNLYGGASRIAEISAIAHERNCKLIFDSAGSLGTRFNDVLVGGSGDCEVFSLHATKIVGAGEGGFVTTNNETVAARVRSMRSSYGNEAPVRVNRTANARLSETQAACARRSLRHLDSFISHNRKIQAMYEEAFSSEERLSPIGVSPGVTSNGSSSTHVLSGGAAGLVDDLVARLWKRGLRARRYYNPGLHTLPSTERIAVSAGEVPNTDHLLSRVLQLPVGGRITMANAEHIAETVLLELAHLG